MRIELFAMLSVRNDKLVSVAYWRWWYGVSHGEFCLHDLQYDSRLNRKGWVWTNKTYLLPTTRHNQDMSTNLCGMCGTPIQLS